MLRCYRRPDDDGTHTFFVGLSEGDLVVLVNQAKSLGFSFRDVGLNNTSPSFLLMVIHEREIAIQEIKRLLEPLWPAEAFDHLVTSSREGGYFIVPFLNDCEVRYLIVLTQISLNVLRSGGIIQFRAEYPMLFLFQIVWGLSEGHLEESMYARGLIDSETDDLTGEEFP